jgi:cell division protein FtsL
VILRVLNLVVIGVLILAAAYVYRVKFDATVQAERLARLRGELRHERDRIAALRAEWEQLDSPARIEPLAKRYLPLRPVAPTQFDTLDRLPEHPAEDLATRADPIGGMIENLEQPSRVEVTGTVPVAGNPDRAAVDRAAGSAASGASSNERSR